MEKVRLETKREREGEPKTASIYVFCLLRGEYLGS